MSNGGATIDAVGPGIERAPVAVERFPGPSAHAGDPLVREREVVRRDVARDGQPGRLRGADVGERRRRRDVRQVQTGAGNVADDVGEDRDRARDRVRPPPIRASP